MKRKTLLIMLLVALFVPLAMNAQTRSLHSPKLDKLEMNSAVARENAQNEMFVKSPVQIPNLESSKFSLRNSDNTMGGRGTRDVIYEPVLTSQTDWSGNYVLAVPFGDNVGYAFGSVDADDHTADIEEVTMDANYNITSIGNASVLTIAPSTSYSSYYTIKINGGDYLADGTSGLETSSTETDYTNWSISLTSDGMQLYNPVWDGGPYYLYFLLFENTSTSQYGAFWLTDDGTSYTSETVSGYEFTYILPYLFKEVSSGSGYTDCDYEKVTDSQSDWSGDYVITYENGSTANVLTGKASGGNYGDYTTATITDNTLANADVAAYNVTIEQITYNNNSYYTIKIGDTYLWMSQSSNALYFSTTDPSTLSTGNTRLSYYWTITGSGVIKNARHTSRNLQWNSSSPRFACYTTTQKAITLFKKLTECEPPCPAPTNLTYSNVTGEGATLAWDGEADSYSIHIGSAPKTYDFEDGSLQGWSAVDNDGDGASWFVMDNDTYSGSHGGDYYVFVSYNDASAVDDWLISPQVQLGGSISFWIKKLNNSSYHDYYRVYVSTTNTDISSFREITSGTIEPATSYANVSYDLSSYSGAGYIAIRHTAAADQAYLFVDDITIVEGGQTIPNATSPYTVTGLNPATEYVWQVMGDCGDGDVSQWSTSSTFTTLDICQAPTGLSSADVTNNSAALSWTGLADTYNIQYREYDATAPVTVILTVGDVWGDGSGYQMLLDADATAYDNFSTNGISDYSIFEYKIPTNADYSASTSNIVVNSSVSIQIPAGTYDCFIANPTPGSQVYVAGTSGNVGGRIDNYVFEAGLTYEFVPSRYGTGDGVDVTITGWTPVSGTVTSPYTLTGLNPGTTYAWQVQGEGCDNWSASNIFTTLNGTLVETITASDVNVAVGATATITPTVLPLDATDPTVSYASANTGIATVDASGIVTGVAAGSTTITISANDGSGISTTINVTVSNINVTGITASDVTVVNGETATISYTVAPSDATDPSVTFTSADETIATVENGVVTGVAVGETTITIASVSNPEVTTEITVTVTSNPNAVQFTVNAPANAHPGDVITVEGVLTAPTNGTYGGFTDLLMSINYDHNAFAFVANSIVYGPVIEQAEQYGSQVSKITNVTDKIQVAINCFEEGYYVTAEGVVFSARFTVLAESGEFTFTGEPNGYTNFDHEIEGGGGVEYIPYEATPSTVVVSALQSFTKTIVGYGVNYNPETDENEHWYLISSPIGQVNPVEVTRLINTAGYDLYYFDQTQELEWINYKAVVGQFDLEPGKGYLYANSETVDLVFTGTAYDGTGEVQLSYAETNPSDSNMYGWNLVGNPFAVDASINKPFYKMNQDGNAILGTQASGAIAPMEGVFVKATESGQSVTFSPSGGSKSAHLAMNLTRGRSIMDRAIVSFDESEFLPKFQFRDGSTKVYIPMDGKDYALVSAQQQGELPVSFKAENNGTYTLSFTSEEVSFGYLHLIDNKTGDDVDLLANPSYTFDARTTDYTSRFKLVFATGSSTSSDTFAFSSNGSFVINNEGNATLQVIDVNGRILKSESINGCANVNVNAAAGVYMLRLINGENVKTQKVVVE